MSAGLSTAARDRSREGPARGIYEVAVAHAMHKAWIAVGLGILIVGLAIGVLGNVQSNVHTLTPTHRSDSYTAGGLLLGTGTVSVAWSEAPTNASFGFYECSSSSCDSAQPIGTGNGSSGQFSTGASNGETFQIHIEGPVLLGSNFTVTIAWGTAGFSYLALGGIVLSLAGTVLVVLAIRRS